MVEEKGTISVHTENIFPIIKKFLYSDHEIFLRELVSNAIDATQKLQKLASMGEFQGELGELKVKVAFDKDAKTITVSDQGIGMTAEEIKKYINQIAFSGATEFVEKYKDKGDDKQIIGHFGLGFYSSFMVAEKVEIVTRSHQDGAEPARWVCDGSTEFEITTAEKAERGTDIILHVADDSTEFLDSWRLRQILEKYCRFLPVPVEFEEKIINDTAPLWTKAPADLTDEDYLSFYKKLYPTAADPLFWVHLNVDYPFNLTGILYFPKVAKDFEMHRDKIQLYSRQVFITDEVKDVVPEFLMLLHGVIDSPDIPLNVSRSFLQADSNVKKINGYISKKVAEKLHELFKADRKAFEEKYDSIDVFVKYGMIADDKFYDRSKAFTLLQNTEGKYFTLDEYQEHIKANQQDKDETLVILYTTDPARQDTYIQGVRDRGYDVLKLDGVIDNHFINTLEQKLEKVSVRRVDSDTLDKLIDKGTQAESVLSDADKEKVKEVFNQALDRKDVNVEALSPDDLPVLITLPEFMRRMKDMARYNGMGAMMGNLPDQINVVVNGNHPLVTRLAGETDAEKQKALAQQAFDLALLSQNMLNGKALTDFVRRSVSFIS
ncbi:molecular chaperone HtpG [Catalinimonas alkaloidigena]|uniref:Chaperone protein HtpG n=1 Tax=Catalinimonas alkaloidigena TaxID=1075417 RepID=A0A1G9DRV3_9BACT|nr:molecular chaperone HtpG [Catalinimonas alkaloidigena]SDK66550.1 molecular chaperone HtpG [Catalinimonas alkaloidigena]